MAAEVIVKNVVAPVEYTVTGTLASGVIKVKPKNKAPHLESRTC